MSILDLAITFFGALFESLRRLALENLVPRLRVAMLRQSVKRPRARYTDKLFWVVLPRHIYGRRSNESAP